MIGLCAAHGHAHNTHTRTRTRTRNTAYTRTDTARGPNTRSRQTAETCRGNREKISSVGETTEKGGESRGEGNEQKWESRREWGPLGGTYPRGSDCALSLLWPVSLPLEPPSPWRLLICDMFSPALPPRCLLCVYSERDSPSHCATVYCQEGQEEGSEAEQPLVAGRPNFTVLPPCWRRKTSLFFESRPL